MSSEMDRNSPSETLRGSESMENDDHQSHHLIEAKTDTSNNMSQVNSDDKNDGENDEISTSHVAQAQHEAHGAETARSKLECQVQECLDILKNKDTVQTNAIKSMAKEIKQLREALLLEDEVIELRIGIKQKEQEIEQLKTKLGNQPDDDSVIAQWKALDSSIKSLASTFFTQAIRPTAVRSPKVVAIFKILTNQHKAYLQSDEAIQLLMQAFIWRLVDQKFFTTPVRIWDDKVDEAFEIIYNSVQSANDDSEGRTMFHEWRAQTALLFDLYIGTDDQAVKEFAYELLEMMRRHSRGVKELDLYGALRKISFNAVQLATILAVSKVHYYTLDQYDDKNERAYGFRFDNTTMVKEHTISGGVEHRVDLVLCPALAKRGDSKGENYEKEIILEKARVCC